MNRLQRDRGAAIPLVALLLPVLILMTAFAVDLGRQRSSRRTMQARADIIALDMVRLADGRTTRAIFDDNETQEALDASAKRNQIEPSKVIEVVWGEFDPDSGFHPHHDPGVQPADLTLVADAVKITTSETTDYFFQPGTGSVTRSAIASHFARTGLTVGSVGAGLQTTLPGGGAAADATVQALNARLGASFGATVPSPGSVGLDALSYEGLAATDVDLWRVAAAGGFASPNELLDAELTAADLFAFTAAALDQQAAEGDPNAAAAAASVRQLGSSIDLATGLDSTNTLRLGDTIDFEQGGDDAAAEGAVNVLDLLSGGAEVINGKSFLAYSFSPAVPGLARVDVQQYVVAPPRTEFGPVGTQAENKQSAFQITLHLAPLLGMSQPITLPIVIEAATAVGTIDAIRCGTTPETREVDVDVDTTLVQARVGTATDLTATGGLNVQSGLVAEANALTLSALLQLGVNVNVLFSITQNLTASGSASLLGASDQLLTFTPDILPVPFQRAQGGIGATALGAQLSNSLSSQYRGLLGTVFQVGSNLATQLNVAFANLDTLVVGPLLTATGLTIGGADVRAHDLDCTSLKLVG